jgi:ribosome-associated protein
LLKITDKISIDENELHFDFVRSSGPGGQNVNKVASAVQLRFDVNGSPSLPDDVRERLTKIAGNKITENGILIIEAKRRRSQYQNRQDAISRLAAMIRKAAEKPRKRHKTKPPAEAKKRRLEMKRRRSEIKKMRKPISKKDIE